MVSAALAQVVTTRFQSSPLLCFLLVRNTSAGNAHKQKRAHTCTQAHAQAHVPLTNNSHARAHASMHALKQSPPHSGRLGCNAGCLVMFFAPNASCDGPCYLEWESEGSGPLGSGVWCLVRSKRPICQPFHTFDKKSIGQHTVNTSQHTVNTQLTRSQHASQHRTTFLIVPWGNLFFTVQIVLPMAS